MDYKFVPDNYDYQRIKELKIDKTDFLKLQIKYKHAIENVLKSIVDFKQIDEYIERQNLSIPIVDDESYNFYRGFSTLGSKYIYLRNNVYIERLSVEEIEEIIKSINEDKPLSSDFINRTYKRVLFENDGYTFYGYPVLEEAVNAQSIVLEFAFNQITCETIPQVNEIKKLFSRLFESLKGSFGKKINIPISMTMYNSIPDIYMDEEYRNLRGAFKE